jgi:hypothetical protein
MGECLICLGATRKLWSPETPCDCRVNVHKICWERWAEHSREACIICKASKYRPRRPDPQGPAAIILLHPVAPIAFPQPHQFRCLRRVVFFVELTMFGLIIYVLLFMITYRPPMGLQEHKPRPIPSWLPLPHHDEL